MIKPNNRWKMFFKTPLAGAIPLRMAGCLAFSILLYLLVLGLGLSLSQWFIPAAHASETNARGRVETRIPAAAKKRDLALIDKFLNAVIQGKQVEARDLLNPYYSGAVGDEKDRQISYASEKLPRLKLFGNKDAVIERVYYFQDVHNRHQHLRYYFVIYKPGMNQLHEVMKIELINNDNIYFMHNVWAPKKGS